MREELKVPKAGESITEGVLAKWVKSEGQSVKEGDVICEIETDKATAEVYAPFSGTVVQTLKKAGDKVLVEEVIGYIESGNAPAGGSAPAAPSTSAAPAAQSAPATPTKSEAPAPNPQPSYGGSNGGPATSAPKSAEVAPRAMPAAQRAAHDTGVALDSVKPTGPKGQILKEDVMKAAAAQASSGTAVAAPSAPAKPAAPASVAKPLPPAQSVTSGDRQQEVVPMSPIRKRIAQRLVEAQQTAALLTTFNEIDMSGVNALRAKFKDTFQERYQTKLGFTSFFVKAVIEALKAFPAVNAEIRGDEIIYKNYYDIGIAVGGGKGLLVPIIRNAERLSFAEVEQTVVDLGSRAKANKIKLEELEGGTFTITNGGIYGSLMSTPIVNPPQSAILGLHAIQDRPVVVDGQVVVRPMMYVALTYDHRIIDGREAVSFLKTVKLAIEDPARILLEV